MEGNRLATARSIVPTQARFHRAGPQVLIDAHHHLWNLDAVHYPWLDDAVVDDFMFGDYSGIRRDYEAEDYRRDAAGFTVLGTVHCEAEADRADPVAETRWLAGQHRRHGVPSAIVAWADFASPEIERTLQAHLAASPLVRGIRCKPKPASAGAVSGGDLDDPSWLAGLGVCQRLGLNWDLRVPWPQLEATAPVAARHDATPIILNHCGLPWDRSAEALAVWRRGLRALARSPHVHVKLSELGLRDEAWSLEANLPILTEVLDIFGPGRCLFASNVPVAGLRVGYGAWVAAVEAALTGFGEDDRDDVFWRNAARIYRIDIQTPPPVPPPPGRQGEAR